jgi:hypothetical protein
MSELLGKIDFEGLFAFEHEIGDERYSKIKEGKEKADFHDSFETLICGFLAQKREEFLIDARITGIVMI